MPYKDMEKRREVSRLSMVKKRKGLTMGVNKAIEVDTRKAAKLLLICRALDKEVTGLDGKRINLLTIVRYGDLTLGQVKASLM